MAKTHSIKSNSVAWNNLNWRQVEKRVFKLQKRIYQASISGNVRKLRRLQKTLLNSYYAKLIAVRKISQDNQGKKTAGTDGIKSLTPNQRLTLAGNLKLDEKSQPIRRVWIPKSNGQQRPLGIPVMQDRAKQALVKAALEPEWEAKFEPNSYGFRPGRSCHDAISAIFNTIRYKSKFVLDADIKKCFDRINHQKLLKKLNTFTKARRQIKAWLKAGILDNGKLLFPEKGTPQGGICSPLLANIALHGIEERIKEFAATLKGREQKAIALIRYADDLVILHENQNVIQDCQEILKNWLAQYDLELSKEKTRITHTLNRHGTEKPGFNFLGFNIRQYPAGKCQSGKNPKGRRLGFKTIIKPSEEKVKEHYNKLAHIVDSHKAAPQQALIAKLAPVITGWSNYYRTVCSGKIYSKIYHLLHHKLRKWSDKRHPNKSKKWATNKYWRTVGGNNWRFGSIKNGKEIILPQHTETKIIRHIKVSGFASPYNGDTNYWASRMGKHPEIKNSIAKLLKKQKGKCNYCGLTFRTEDKIEKDHIVPRKAGGHEYKDNLQLLHRHCHDQKTKDDLKVIKAYKAHQEHKKLIKWFNQLDWQWVDDIPTLV